MAQMIFRIDLAATDRHLAHLEEAIDSRTVEHRPKAKVVASWRKDLKRIRGNIAKRQTRQRRNIFTWIASTLGIYNGFKIHQVKGTINNVKAATTKIVKEVDLIQKHVQSDSANIKTIADELKSEQLTLWNLLREHELLKEWSTVRATIIAIRTVLTTLTSHKLAHDMVDLVDLDEEWESMKRKIATKGLKPVIEDWQYLFQLKTAYVVQAETVIVAVQVPVTAKHSLQFQLYRLNEIPIVIAGRILIAKTEHKFIGVQGESSAAIPLSQGQIKDRTTEMGNQWYYEGPRVEAHEAPSTCIHARWLANATAIDQLCHLSATTTRELVQPVNDSTALWAVSGPTMITTICPGRATKTDSINTTSLITLPTRCRASSRLHTFVPANANEAEVKIVVKIFEAVDQTNDTDGQWGRTTWKLQQPPTMIRRGKEIQAMLDNAEPPLIPTWVAVAIAATALVAVAIFIGWLYLQARRQWTLGSVIRPTTEHPRDEAEE